MIGGTNNNDLSKNSFKRKKRASFKMMTAYNVIAKYEKNEWFLFGNIPRSRRSHASIIFGSEVMVIGGLRDDFS